MSKKDNIVDFNKHYIKIALGTENKEFSSIADRIIDNPHEVLSTLNQAILALQKLDEVVKKNTFYGKPAKYYEAPLFTMKDGKLSDKQLEIIKSKEFIRLLHGFMGIATESGEGLEALATLLSTDKGLDKVNVGEELGDVFWYSALIADECSTSFDNEMTKNSKKLEKRHGKSYSEDTVMNRDLDAERDILEGKK